MQIVNRFQFEGVWLSSPLKFEIKEAVVMGWVGGVDTGGKHCVPFSLI